LSAEGRLRLRGAGENLELGIAVAAGEGVSKDDARATRLYAKGCDADFGRSCNNLAWQYQRGTGATKDERRARELFAQACKLGDSDACDWMAKKDGKPQEYCDRGARTPASPSPSS
jgi:TPR repeat protein